MEAYRTVKITIISAEVFMKRSDMRIYAMAYMDDDFKRKKITHSEWGLKPRWGTTMGFEVREKMLTKKQLIIKLSRKRPIVSDKTIGEVRINRNDLVNNANDNQSPSYDVCKYRILSSPKRRGQLIVSFRLEEVCYHKVPNKVVRFAKGITKFGLKPFWESPHQVDQSTLYNHYFSSLPLQIDHRP
uniref:C2 domain-containing protein n=1 Tax=Nelumbo nucifera TaxID=4432 RepID=A0A822YZ28_NELNU|nr:TPA_asm: hypothetical protein HUJ06_006626 [Nelumbo nucifera]